MHSKVTASEVVELVLQEVVQLYGLLDTIVSDRDSKCTNTLLQELHQLLGVKLLMCTAFQPHTDGATK